MVRRFFSYIAGYSSAAPGAGVDALALRQPQTLPSVNGFNNATYAIQGSFAPLAPGFNKDIRQFASVALVGNGLNLQGQLELQRLAELQGG